MPLKESKKTITKAILWKIPHNSDIEDISLKIGRYNKNISYIESPETETPRSELTLTYEELQNLINFLSECYEPFKKGVKKFIPLDENFDYSKIEHLKAIFANPQKKEILNLIVTNDIIPSDLLIALSGLERKKSISDFESMLEKDLLESKWQIWFSENSWVLGSEFVQILDERSIDTNNIVDYLMKAYDGFVDIVEIKRPDGGLKFWSETKDHGNYYPHSDLTKAITQATKYIHAVELEANSVKFLEKVGQVKTIKPRCVLIYGRSNNWNPEQMEAYRILNASFHNLTIMTYDHVLSRARQIVGFH
ncbi:hypothetical protein CH372_19820 [Leptospira meyeri]|nr:hypothetical protein CH372_19820 [Leptospira meyeri]